MMIADHQLVLPVSRQGQSDFWRKIMQQMQSCFVMLPLLQRGNRTNNLCQWILQRSYRSGGAMASRRIEDKMRPILLRRPYFQIGCQYPFLFQSKNESRSDAAIAKMFRRPYIHRAIRQSKEPLGYCQDSCFQPCAHKQCCCPFWIKGDRRRR